MIAIPAALSRTTILPLAGLAPKLSGVPDCLKNINRCARLSRLIYFL
jgi:hypothetical protein